MRRRVASIGAVLAAAAAIRLWVAWTRNYAVFADETFQYLEQGHRLAFGYGVVPWEFAEGLRSWLLPGAIAGLMRAAAAIADRPDFYIPVVRSACALLSLSVVWTGWRFGARRGAPWLAAAFPALWFDLVWFAPAALTETVAAHVALLALARLDGARGGGIRAGLLLGLAVCLRYQYAPALFLAAAWTLRLDFAAWRRAALGGALAAGVFGGALDWASWGAPFGSVWAHLLRNTAGGVASSMGVEPAGYFLGYLDLTLWPLPLLLPLAALGAIRAPALGLAALATLAIHSAIPHKEPRFVYLAIAIAPILAGLGAAEVARRLPKPAAAGAVALWAALSWFQATGTGLAARWQLGRGPLEAFQAAGRQPGLTGLAVRDMRLIDGGGYVHLHRDVPVYFADNDPAVEIDGRRVRLPFFVDRAGARTGLTGPDGAAFSHLIAGSAPEGFDRVACFPPSALPEDPVPCLFARR